MTETPSPLGFAGGANPTPAPPVPRLGPAEQHRIASETAAAHQDYNRAVRERYRAVVRGLEQGGVLEPARGRTAHEAAAQAGFRLPSDASGLTSTAALFDEVVYGTRSAGELEFRYVSQVDRFSQAPPPPPEPEISDEPDAPTRRRRKRLRPIGNSRMWAIVLAIAVVVLLVVAVILFFASAPPSPPPASGPPPDPGDLDSPELPDVGGNRSIFETLPAPVAFGGLQLLIAVAAVAVWRARRRGALVGEPRPVEVPANELMYGQANLYRRARDPEHVAGRLRAATMRRIRPKLGLPRDAAPAAVAAAVHRATGLPAASVAFAMDAPVDSDEALEAVVRQLERIEAEVAGA